MVEQNIKEVLGSICGCVNSFVEEGVCYIAYTDNNVYVKYKGLAIVSIKDDVVYNNIFLLKIGTIEKRTLESLATALQHLVSLRYREKENINL